MEFYLSFSVLEPHSLTISLVWATSEYYQKI